MQFRLVGQYFPSGVSHCIQCTLEADVEGRVQVAFDGKVLLYRKNEYTIEPSLGSTRRVVTFWDGGRFECEPQEEFERFSKAMRSSPWLAGVDWLERRWTTALLCVAAVALIIYSFAAFGIPAIASYIAFRTSQELRVKISKQTLDSMTRMGQLEASDLEEDQLARSNRAFARALVLAGLEESDYQYQLHHYDMGGVENAFALPSGMIVATDAFVEMCETETQLLAVYLHEIAHVEQQHGIRSVIQRTGILVIASMVLGDVSSVANVTAALPALLLDSRYSQGFEMESDTYAAVTLQESGIGAEPMKEVLILLHKDQPEVPLAAFLSSHPSLRERIRNIEEIEERGD